MSYRRNQSQYSSASKMQVYNPEAAIPHIVRMQNLLEEYDRENCFLNKQVSQLLTRKKQFDRKFGLSHATNRIHSSSNQGRSFHLDETKLDAKNRYATGRQKIANKLKKYQYVQENEHKSPNFAQKFKSTFDTSGRKQTRHYSYTPYEKLQQPISKPSNRRMSNYEVSYSPNLSSHNKLNLIDKNKLNNMAKRIDKFPYTKPFVVSEEQHQYMDGSKNKKDEDNSPQSTSRFINEEEVKKQNKLPIRQSQKIQIIKNHSVPTLINKQPYIGSPGQRDTSKSNSPQKRISLDKQNSIVSLRSSKSGKRGISVISSDKSMSIEKERQKEKEKEKEKERQKQLQKYKQMQKQKQNQEHLRREEENLKAQTQKQRQRLKQIEQSLEKQKQRLRQKQKQLERQLQKCRQRQKAKQEQKNPKESTTQIQKKVSFVDNNTGAPKSNVQLSIFKQNKPQFGEPKPVQNKNNHTVINNPGQIKYQAVPLVSYHSYDAQNQYSRPTGSNFVQNRPSLQENYQNVTQVHKKLSYGGEIRQQGLNAREHSVLAKKKSFSQHRIQPSEKISYEQGTNLHRGESSASIRTNSKDTKRKFLKVISFDIIAKKNESC